MGKVTLMMPRCFSPASKAERWGHFEATRFATGYQNKNGVEIHGEKGAVSIDFEDMTWLRFYDRGDERKLQGWTDINVSHAPRASLCRRLVAGGTFDRLRAHVYQSGGGHAQRAWR